MERNIQLNWEVITNEARRRRKDRDMTQARLALLAKVSRSTVVRFEANDEDIQLSSALRILGVLDMLDRMQEGTVLIQRSQDRKDRSTYLVMFAPHTPDAGRMEPKQFDSSSALEQFLASVGIPPETQQIATLELERDGNTSIPFSLTASELRQFWPGVRDIMPI